MKVYVYVWSEAERVFFSHKESWVLMKFGGRKFKVMFEAFETLRFLTEFHSTFLLKISVSLLAIFFWFLDPFLVDNGALFIGKALVDS